MQTPQTKFEKAARAMLPAAPQFDEPYWWKNAAADIERLVAEELTELRKDRTRLEWVMKILNEVGTTGFGEVVGWDCSGLSREDIDAAIRHYARIDTQEAEDTSAGN